MKRRVLKENVNIAPKKITIKLCTVLICMIINHSYSAVVINNGVENVFIEEFVWSGNHAAHILNAQATTVWWDEASWDVRGDTSFISVEPINSTISNRFHIDIHKALSGNPKNGLLSNTLPIIGGNGDTGVAVMHLDYQDILSARARNPLIISQSNPAYIEFYASAFVTTGHWWEIALTPASEISAGEYTSVPGQFDRGLPAPIGNDLQPGPGHDSPMDSINLISLGATDVPCISGWWTRFGLTKTVDQSTIHYINQVNSLDELTSTDPDQADVLEHWRIQILPNQMSLLIDRNDDNQFELVESWNVTIPWAEVFVHFLAVAYQADHHPQEPCFVGHIRELKWRNITMRPVKYIQTDVYPKNDGIIQTGKVEGWQSHDIRDIQRFGMPINSVPQPNLNAFTTGHSGQYCNDLGFPCFSSDLTVLLSFDLPDVPMNRELVGGQLVADLKNSFSTPQLPINASINNISIGDFVTAESVPSVEESAWMRSSITIPIGLLEPTLSNSLNLTLGSNSYLDRIEIELYYQSIVSQESLIFKNGFE